MWLCTKQKAQNRVSMDAKANQLSRNHGLNLVYLVGFNALGHPDARARYFPGPQHGPVPQLSQGSRKPSNFKAFRTIEKKLKNRARKATNSKVEVVQIPEGNPMFMFQDLQEDSASIRLL